MYCGTAGDRLGEGEDDGELLGVFGGGVVLGGVVDGDGLGLGGALGGD